MGDSSVGEAPVGREPNGLEPGSTPPEAEEGGASPTTGGTHTSDNFENVKLTYSNTDRFGFFEERGGKQEDVDRRKLILKENMRIQKWTEMIYPDWDAYQRKHADKVKHRIRKGIPDCLRGLMWQVISGSRDLSSRNPGLYEQLAAHTDSPCDDEIHRDISRTFPKHIFFREKNGAGQTSLFNVLKAYSVYDQEVGYCQGMGFITGLLLLYMSEEDAFWLVVSLMKNYSMEGLFKPKLPLLNQYLYTFDHLLEHFLPRLHAHFKNEVINPSMYASQWFITVFAYNFPFALVLRIWDIFLNEGVKIVFRVGLALLKKSQDTLLAMNFEDSMGYLKSFPKHILRQDKPDELMKTALNIPLRTKKLEHLAMEWKERGE